MQRLVTQYLIITWNVTNQPINPHFLIPEIPNSPISNLVYTKKAKPIIAVLFPNCFDSAFSNYIHSFKTVAFKNLYDFSIYHTFIYSLLLKSSSGACLEISTLVSIISVIFHPCQSFFFLKRC